MTGNIKKTFIDALKLQLGTGANSGAMGNSNSMGASSSSGGSNTGMSGMQMTKKEDINYLSLFTITDPTSNSGNSKSKLFRLWLTCNTKFIVN